jgi:hypothetical protein
MTGPAPARARSPLDTVRAAIDAFNHGDAGALIPGEHPSLRPGQIAPDAAAAAIEERPISISRISSLDARRVFCALVTAHGSELVGVYSLANGRIADARHYFSDVDLLVCVGILDRDEAESTKAQSSR